MTPHWRIAVYPAVALLLTSCARKPDARESTRQFFELVASGKTQEAHASASFAFQAEQSSQVFGQTAREKGLIGAKAISVEPVEEAGKEVKIRATLTTTEGEERIYLATLQNESGVWKVFSIVTPRSGGARVEKTFSTVGKGSAFADALAQPVPDEATMSRLIERSMGDFNEAIHRRSFTEFYQTVATSWQGQLSEKQLQRAFQPFIDQDVDISGALKLPPALDTTPQVTTDGLLIVSGHYPSKPYHVEFSLKYIYEMPDWKLFGIDVNLRKAPEQ